MSVNMLMDLYYTYEINVFKIHFGIDFFSLRLDRLLSKAF